MTDAEHLLIRSDDLSGPEIAELLREHLREMHEITPPESVHALDLEALRSPSISFWTLWQDGELAGCGALKQLDQTSGEIKSMRTARAHRGKGVARVMLEHILLVAKKRGYTCLFLETGAMKEFLPARNLYLRYGFEPTEPFADYVADPNSVFMRKQLR